MAPYITSTLLHNENTTVEICLESVCEFRADNEKSVEILHDMFDDRFHLREADFSRYPANHIRFLETPSVISDYTYVGDIDILILEEIASIHLRNMQRTNLPYSNIVRPGKERMSGLHFTKTADRYPLCILSDDKLNLSDEEILYWQVAAQGGSLPSSDDTFRPLHGYHLSLQRQPRPTGISWGFRNNLPQIEYFNSYLRLRDRVEWRSALSAFDPRYLMLLAILDVALGFMHPSEDLALLPKYTARRLFEAMKPL
ncbi:hypothetical protein VQ042_22380 [Aurantimonas sp. A2-1-M11]|uniref:hypothetical protein n=1 Tax=Aurantimonas sp. A2-1-M11 TaxID=3113712 RepID=UPI002F93C966